MMFAKLTCITDVQSISFIEIIKVVASFKYSFKSINFRCPSLLWRRLTSTDFIVEVNKHDFLFWLEKLITADSWEEKIKQQAKSDFGLFRGTKLRKAKFVAPNWDEKLLTLYSPLVVTPSSNVISMLIALIKHKFPTNSTIPLNQRLLRNAKKEITLFLFITGLLARSFKMLSKVLVICGTCETWLKCKGSELVVVSRIDPMCLMSNAFLLPTNNLSSLV